jgi:hypothetical protein
VQRLLDEQQAGHERLEGRLGAEGFPQPPERLDLLEVFVAVEGEGVIAGDVGRDDVGDAAESVEVARGVAPELDLEMGEAVAADAVFQGLREAVVDAVGVGDFARRERVG